MISDGNGRRLGSALGPVRASGQRARLPAVSAHVSVITCNRPVLLTRLLGDLATLGPGLSVSVFDDATDVEKVAPVLDLLAERGWSYRRSGVRLGKQGFWRTVSLAMNECRQVPSELYVFLPDDIRLCRDFLAKVHAAWSGIRDPRKIALNLLVDSRAGGSCWTGIEPKKVGDVVRTGWIDGLFVCGKEYLEALDYQASPPMKDRWTNAPGVSSGVYSAISRRLVSMGKEIYRVQASLVSHVSGPSMMNPEAREKDSLSAKTFVDGEHSCAALSSPEPVVASLASMPSRREQLRQAVGSLLPQVDRVAVYLNDYPDVPGFLRHPRIEVVRSQDHLGDLGDSGKFYGADSLSGYHLTCDDDLLYPPDYVRTLLEAVERHGRRALVGVHGAKVTEPIESYYRSRQVFGTFRLLEAETQVHVLGTGTLAYHTSAIEFGSGHCQAKNMADIWLAISAKAQKVPMFCIPRPAHWIGNLLSAGADAIYDRMKDNDTLQTSAIREAGPWT